MMVFGSGVWMPAMFVAVPASNALKPLMTS
jgi:hypothetical protein